jgi:putative ATPase
LGHGTGYQYPHDDERGILEQQYAPDLLADRIYYRPTEHGVEARVAERLRAIRAILGRAEGSGPA